MLEGGANQAKAFGAAAFDDGGKEQAVQKTIEWIGPAELEQRLDVRVFADFFSQLHAAL